MTASFDQDAPLEGEDGWSAEGDARRPLQPANPSDLERHPPVGAACRATRNRLRDYVDGDLPPALVRSIDEHVHGCRSCSLALARAEHEVLLFRDALEPDGRRAQIERPRLVRSIVARAAAELAIDEDRRVRRRARRTLRPAGVAAFAVVGLAVIFGVIEAVRSLSGPERVDSGITVAFAESASLRSPSGGTEPLDVGELLTIGEAGVTFETGPRGSLGWRSRHNQGRLDEFELAGDGEVRIATDRSTRLIRGELEVQSSGPLEIGLGPDAVGGGAFGVVRAPASTDNTVLSLASEPVVSVGDRSGHVGLPRLRIEVLRASVPIRFQAGEESVEVAEGQVASVSPGRDLRVEPGLNAAAVLASIDASRNRVPEGPRGDAGPQLRILDARGEPLPDATVHVRSMGRATMATTDAAGAITLPKRDRLLIDVLPPDGSAASSFVPRFVRGVDTIWSMPLERTWNGRVAGVDGRALGRAALIPMLVDELFGRIHPLQELAVQSDAEGRFDLRRLPVKLLPYQRLVVQVSPRTGPAFVVEAPSDVSRSGIAQPTTRMLALGGLSTAGFVELIEELPGLSLRSAVIWHRRRPDRFGRVDLETWGRGRVWLVQNGRLVGFVSNPEDPSMLVPGSVSAGSDELLRQLGGVTRPYRSGSSIAIAEGRRHAQLHRTDAADRRQVVVAVDSARVSLEETTIYLELADGRIEVVGRAPGFESFVAEPSERPYRLIGVGAGGSVGVKEIAGNAYADYSLEVPEPGRVVWPEERRVPSSIELVGIRGMTERLSFVVSPRPDSSRFGSVPPGRYEIRVEGERLGEVVIEAGADARPAFD